MTLIGVTHVYPSPVPVPEGEGHTCVSLVVLSQTRPRPHLASALRVVMFNTLRLKLKFGSMIAKWVDCCRDFRHVRPVHTSVLSRIILPTLVEDFGITNASLCNIGRIPTTRFLYRHIFRSARVTCNMKNSTSSNVWEEDTLLPSLPGKLAASGLLPSGFSRISGRS